MKSDTVNIKSYRNRDEGSCLTLLYLRHNRPFSLPPDQLCSQLTLWLYLDLLVFVAPLPRFLPAQMCPGEKEQLWSTNISNTEQNTYKSLSYGSIMSASIFYFADWPLFMYVDFFYQKFIISLTVLFSSIRDLLPSECRFLPSETYYLLNTVVSNLYQRLTV